MANSRKSSSTTANGKPKRIKLVHGAQPQAQNQDQAKGSADKDEGETAEERKSFLDLVKERCNSVKKEFDEDEESEDEEDSDEEIRVNVQCYQREKGSGSPFKATNLLGAQRSFYLTKRTSLKEFIDLLMPKVLVELENNRKDWEIVLTASGRGHSFGKPTELDLKDSKVDQLYADCIEIVIGGCEGTVKVVGARKPAPAKTIAQGKDAAAGDEMQKKLDALDEDVRTAMLKIWTANRCGDHQCGQKSVLYPACWPLPGGTRHLNLTVEATLDWATSLADKQDGIKASFPPPVAPYSTHGPTKAEKKKEAVPGKENEPIVLSQASSDGFEVIHKAEFTASSAFKAAQAQEQNPPVYGEE